MKKGLLIFGLIFVVTGCSFQPLADDKTLKEVSKIEVDKIHELDQEKIEEEEFNNSGRAKAIEDETDLWAVYEDSVVGFGIKYPHNVSFDNEERGLLTLKIESELVNDLEGTMGYNKETALDNIEALENGDYGEDVDFPLEISKKIRDVGNINAQEFMVLGRFEICDVALERKLYFFNNDYQVVITLSTSKDEIVGSMSEYFELNKDNCGEDMIWDFDKQDDFYNTLVAGKGSEVAQEWFDAFDEIVNTIEFFEAEEKVNYFEALQGDWVSVDDEKSEIEFKDNVWINYYDGESKMSFEYKLFSNLSSEDESIESKYGKYMVVENGGDKLEYIIENLDDKKFDLIYLPRGNALEFIKK